MIVSQRTLQTTFISQAVLPVVQHPTVAVRMQAGALLAAWKQIYMENCLPMSSAEFHMTIH